MYKGFPKDLVALLRCPGDGGELSAPPDGQACLLEGRLRCRHCGAEYPVRDGIVQLLDAESLDADSRHEMQLREMQALSYDAGNEGSEWHLAEMRPTLEALPDLHDAILLEIGCGTGRYTVQVAGHARATLAVDFSRTSLMSLAQRLDAAWPVGLVQADATRPMVGTAQVDAALCTLYSNLPTPGHRQAFLAATAAALRPGGRLVFSAHQYGMRQRWRGEARSAPYEPGGIYRYLFERDELAAEAASHFGEVNCHAIKFAVPLGRRLGLPVVRLSRWAEGVPALGPAGALLLVTASKPARLTRGSRWRA